jgi:hypothetical protein
MTAKQIYAITNGMLRATFMVQKGAHKRIFALEEYARVFNTISAEKGGNFFISLLVYIFESGVLEESEFSNITKELNNKMKSKTMTIKEHWIAEGVEMENFRSRYEFARKLIHRNMSLEEICELTDLSMDEVKRLASEMSNQ